MPVPIICEHCGVSFPTEPNRAKAGRKYCSRKCYFAHKTRDLSERFWEKVDVRGPDECWPWKAGKDKKGYGRFVVRFGKWMLAHRLAYELTVGPIPDGKDVCHSCDSPGCCNKAHHFIGTHIDNNADAFNKARKNGHGYGSAKLSPDQVRQIRELASQGRSRKEIGVLFGVTDVSIGNIINGKTWR